MRFLPNLSTRYFVFCFFRRTRFRKRNETAEWNMFCWNHSNSNGFTGILRTSFRFFRIHFQKDEVNGRPSCVRWVHRHVKNKKSSDRGHLFSKHPSKDELMIFIIWKPGLPFSRHAFTSMKLVAVAFKAAERSLSPAPGGMYARHSGADGLLRPARQRL